MKVGDSAVLYVPGSRYAAEDVVPVTIKTVGRRWVTVEGGHYLARHSRFDLTRPTSAGGLRSEEGANGQFPILFPDADALSAWRAVKTAGVLARQSLQDFGIVLRSPWPDRDVILLAAAVRGIRGAT